jgi:hypothetical protein
MVCKKKSSILQSFLRVGSFLSLFFFFKRKVFLKLLSFLIIISFEPMDVEPPPHRSDPYESIEQRYSIFSASRYYSYQDVL